MIPDLVLGCLAQAVPERVPAEGASALWILAMSGGRAGGVGDRRAFGVNCFHNGGTGARPGKDGLSATAFPSGVSSGSVEVTEAATPLVFWRKAFREGSGGDPAPCAAGWDRPSRSDTPAATPSRSAACSTGSIIAARGTLRRRTGRDRRGRPGLRDAAQFQGPSDRARRRHGDLPYAGRRRAGRFAASRVRTDRGGPGRRLRRGASVVDGHGIVQRHPSAVGIEDLAGDVGRLRRGQEHGDGGDLRWLARAA